MRSARASSIDNSVLAKVDEMNESGNVTKKNSTKFTEKRSKSVKRGSGFVGTHRSNKSVIQFN